MKKLKEKNGGYALLFTIVVVGIISMITIGLSNATYKHIILSSVARDSIISFYQSDLAAECILYADNETSIGALGDTLECGDYTLGITPTVIDDGITKITTYEFDSSIPVPTSINKCFRATVTKTETVDEIRTKVEARGYNICNKSNIRTVERTIEVNY